MVLAGDHEFRVPDGNGYALEGLQQQFQAFVCSPLSKCQDALRIATPAEIRWLRIRCEDAVRPQMDVLTAILPEQCLAVLRQQHRDGIGEEQQPGGDPAEDAIEHRVLYSGSLEVE